MKSKWRMYLKHSIEEYYKIVNFTAVFDWDYNSQKMIPSFEWDYDISPDLEKEICILGITFDDSNTPCEYTVSDKGMPHKVEGWKEINDFLIENDYVYEPLRADYNDGGFDTLIELEDNLNNYLDEQISEYIYCLMKDEIEKYFGYNF